MKAMLHTPRGYRKVAGMLVIELLLPDGA